MNSQEALKILSLSENCSKEDIKKAYRKNAKLCHPDKGGSEEQMKRINEAKDVLDKWVETRGKGPSIPMWETSDPDYRSNTRSGNPGGSGGAGSGRASNYGGSGFNSRTAGQKTGNYHSWADDFWKSYNADPNNKEYNWDYTDNYRYSEPDPEPPKNDGRTTRNKDYTGFKARYNKKETIDQHRFYGFVTQIYRDMLSKSRSERFKGLLTSMCSLVLTTLFICIVVTFVVNYFNIQSTKIRTALIISVTLYSVGNLVLKSIDAFKNLNEPLEKFYIRYLYQIYC